MVTHIAFLQPEGRPLLTRRPSLQSSTAVSAAGLGLQAQAKQSCGVFMPATQAAVTPTAALQLLKDDNTRFTKGKTRHCDQLQQLKGTASQQSPFAVVLRCMDSRMPPELVFDQRIGDIFAIRTADNAQLGNLTATLANIRPLLDNLNSTGILGSRNKDLLQKLADQNARDAVDNIIVRSEVIKNLVTHGKVRVVCAMHVIATGTTPGFPEGHSALTH